MRWTRLGGAALALVLTAAACGPALDQAALEASGTEGGGTTALAGRIVFVTRASGPGYNLEIFSMDADGSDQSRLTDNPGHDHQPAWSPDGSEIAFSSGQPDSDLTAILSMKADGSGLRTLTEDWPHVGVPRWSPDGGQIAVAGDRGDGTQIYLVDVATGDLTQVSDEPDPTGVGGAYQPDWSPDGQRIIHMRTRFDDQQNSSSRLYVMNADGSDVTLLPTGASTESGPRWSPDGSKVAFITGRDGATEIYVMNIDGSNVTRVTDSPGDDFTPAWSPDGTQLAFASDRDGQTQIYVASSDGTNVSPLTDVSGGATNPDWTSSESEDVASDEDSDEDASKYVGFKPDSRSEDGVTVTPITFLDGSYAEVVAPRELRLRGLTASMYTGGGLGGSGRTMDFRYRDGSTFMHEGPLETYEGADGSPVEWWRRAPGTGCPNLVFRFGDWFVGVRTCQDQLSEEERASWARLLSGSIVDGGFLVLSAEPPLKLAEARGASPETILGMEDPFNWVKLTPGRCDPDTFATDGDRQTMADGTQVTFNRLGDGNSKLEYDWFVSWCEDELMRVQVQYAYEGFAKAAAEGLRLRDIVLAD